MIKMLIFLKRNDFERNWLRLYVYTERKSIFGITAHQTLNHNLQIMSTRYIEYVQYYWDRRSKRFKYQVACQTLYIVYISLYSAQVNQ